MLLFDFSKAASCACAQVGCQACEGILGAAIYRRALCSVCGPSRFWYTCRAMAAIRWSWWTRAEAQMIKQSGSTRLFEPGMRHTEASDKEMPCANGVASRAQTRPREQAQAAADHFSPHRHAPTRAAGPPLLPRPLQPHLQGVRLHARPRYTCSRSVPHPTSSK